MSCQVISFYFNLRQYALGITACSIVVCGDGFLVKYLYIDCLVASKKGKIMGTASLNLIGNRENISLDQRISKFLNMIYLYTTALISITVNRVKVTTIYMINKIIYITHTISRPLNRISNCDI